MDLVYVPEVLTYGFFRSQQYRDYEQPWNKDYFHNGRSTQSHCQRVSQHHEQKVLSKDNCHLCRESKRRSLAAYIKGKSRRSSCEEIHEEEEEQDTANNRDRKVNIDERPSYVENKTLKITNEQKTIKESNQ